MCSRVHFQDFNTFWFYSKTWDLILGVRRLNHPILGSKISKTIFKLWNGLKIDFSDRSRPRRNHLKQFQCARDHREMGVNIVVLIKLDIKRGLYMYKGEFCQVVTSEKKNYVHTTIFTGNSALIHWKSKIGWISVLKRHSRFYLDWKNQHSWTSKTSNLLPP